MVNEKSRVSASIRADDFGDCAFPETAIVRSTEKGNTNLSARMSGWMLKAFRQKIAQIDNLPTRCHSRRWHNRRICSSEHNNEGTQTVCASNGVLLGCYYLLAIPKSAG